MKKLFTLLSLMALICLSANVWAQTNSGITPEIGSTHIYSVNEHTGSNYAWTVTTTPDVGGTDLLGTIVTGTSSTYQISLTWVNPTANTKYYIHVIETGSNNCTNHKVLAIQPFNNFQLDIVNVNSTGTTIATDYNICASDVSTISWNGGTNPVSTTNANDFTYTYGAETFYYKVTATGITGTDWLPVFTIAQNPDNNATVTAEWATTINGTYTSGLKTDGTNNTITVSGSNEFFIKVTVANSTVEEGTTASTYTIDLDKDASKDKYDNVATSTNSDSAAQTINARPSTGNISY